MTGEGVAELMDRIGAALGLLPLTGAPNATGWQKQGLALSVWRGSHETMLTDGSVELTVQADEKLLGQMRQRQVQVET